MNAEGHVARKRFGQHFLTDERVIHRLVECIAPCAQDAMVEIGPGLSALTRPLLERLAHLHAIEIDRDLAQRLRAQARLTVHQADVLTVDFTQLAQKLSTRSLRVVGNLPYNISTPILFHLLDHVAVVQDQHFMLQKEVVERMVALPETAAYGRLSVMLQWRYEMENVLDVPPEAFTPAPKVHSAVVRMVPRSQALTAQNVQPLHLSELVKVAFSQRRKLLRHTLGRWLTQRGFTGPFDVQRRAEEVSVSEYLELALQTQTPPQTPTQA